MPRYKNRKDFCLRTGFEMRNVTWSWCAVNHDSRQCMFFVWEHYTRDKVSGKDSDKSVYLVNSDEWEYEASRNRALPGYRDILDKIHLCLDQGYQALLVAQKPTIEFTFPTALAGEEVKIADVDYDSLREASIVYRAGMYWGEEKSTVSSVVLEERKQQQVTKEDASKTRPGIAPSFGTVVRTSSDGEHFVYMFQLEGTNFYKIGYSNDVDRRLAEFNSSPHAIWSQKSLVLVDQLAFDNADDAYQVEQNIHRQLSKYDMGGECFKINKRDVVRVALMNGLIFPINSFEAD